MLVLFDNAIWSLSITVGLYQRSIQIPNRAGGGGILGKGIQFEQNLKGEGIIHMKLWGRVCIFYTKYQILNRDETNDTEIMKHL